MARKPRAAAATEAPQANAQPLSATIGKADIKRSAVEAWRKLDAVIQTELTAVQEGKKELNASTATAIIKYIEASIDLARGSEDVSPKDAEDRQKALLANLTLPTFDDEQE